jgi:hypothetical protein
MGAGREGVTLLIWRRCMAYPNQIVIYSIKETGSDLELNIQAIWRKSMDSLVFQGFIAMLRKIAARSRS